MILILIANGQKIEKQNIKQSFIRQVSTKKLMKKFLIILIILIIILVGTRSLETLRETPICDGMDAHFKVIQV